MEGHDQLQQILEQTRPQIAEAIFLCEFHETVGNTIIFCYPEDELKKDFDQIQDFMIPKEELCGKLIIIEFRKDHYVLGLPVLLRNKENVEIYNRSIFIFSVCIMVRKDQYLLRKFWYQETVRKLALFFTALEIETHYIYKNVKEVISEKITNLYKSLNEEKECLMEYNEDQYIFVKYIESIKPQSSDEGVLDIKDYMVPISLLSTKAFDDILEQYDSELYRVYKEINGEKCVKKISRDLGKDPDKLESCLRNLYMHRVIKFVDIFRLTNHYQVTHGIHEFMRNPALQSSCAKYISASTDKKLHAKEIVYLYLQLCRQKAILDVVIENKDKFDKINLVQFIQFGIIYEFVERVHKYCLLSNEIEFFNETNINLVPQLFNTKRNSSNMNPTSSMNSRLFTPPREVIMYANREFNRLVRQNAPLDQFLVEFQITEETFYKITELTSFIAIHK